MEKLLIGVADDDENIHNLLDEFISSKNDIFELEHFYDPGDVIEFLEDNGEDAISMLFLDIDFHGSIRGTEALPEIKEVAPDLPVIFFTGISDDKDIEELIKRKLVADYLEKPISKKLFLNKIALTNNYSEDVRLLQKEIKDNEATLVEIELEYKQKYDEELEKFNSEYQALENDKQTFLIKKEQFQERIDKLASNAIPETIKSMFQRTYFNLEFRDSVIVELFGKNYDERIFALLSKVNNNLPLGYGEKVQLFREGAVPDLYEYRISQKARLFIQKRYGKKMLVYDVDYCHDKH